MTKVQNDKHLQNTTQKTLRLNYTNHVKTRSELRFLGWYEASDPLVAPVVFIVLQFRMTSHERRRDCIILDSNKPFDFVIG